MIAVGSLVRGSVLIDTSIDANADACMHASTHACTHAYLGAGDPDWVVLQSLDVGQLNS